MLNFHTDDAAAWTLSNDELIAAIRWRKNHGTDAAKAAKAGADAFSAWLAKPSSLPKWTVRGSVPDPLWQVLWSRNAFERTGRSQTVAGVVEHFAADTAKKTRGEMLRMLLHEFDGSVPADPFELLALTTLLQTRRSELKDRTRLTLFRVVLLSARDFAVEIDATPPGYEPADQHLVRRGELPILIGRVFDAVHGSSHLRREGRQTLARLLEEETDTDGTPHGRILERLPLFVASMARSVSSQRRNGRPTFKEASQKRFAALAQQTALLAGQDGRPALSTPDAFAPASLIHAAVSLAALPTRDPGRRAAALIESDLPAKASVKQKLSGKTPKFSVSSGQSEWGGLATFRGDFATPKFDMTVDFHGTRPRVEFRLDGQSVVSGYWDVETRVGGEALPEPDGWASVCWFSDDEADYLELEANLPGGVQLTRHIMYAHDDEILILSAAVRYAGEATVESTVRMPLADGVAAKGDTHDRLVHLKGGAPARLVPLGLEADPFRSTPGHLAIEPSAIEVRQANPADGLCIPIAFDLNPRSKQRRQIDWRRLTVAEAGRALSKGRGDAWRLRVGDQDDSPQWVYYQGLAKQLTSRTVLGLHTPYEMVFGRFEAGEIDPLVHVESD